MSQRLTLGAIILAVAGIAVQSGAIDLPGVGKDAASVPKPAQASNGASAEVAQVEIVKRFDGTLTGFIEAQVLLRRAFDIADESAAKGSDAEALGLENCEDQDCLEAKIGMSERNQVEIDKALEEGRELDDAGKQAYNDALPLYARATIDLGELVPEVGQWSTAAQREIKDAGIRNARAMRKTLQVGMYVARHTPTLAKTFSSATKGVVTYGNAKQLDTSAANDVEF